MLEVCRDRDFLLDLEGEVVNELVKFFGGVLQKVAKVFLVHALYNVFLDS